MHSNEAMCKFESLIEQGLAQRVAYALVAKIIEAGDPDPAAKYCDLPVYIGHARSGISDPSQSGDPADWGPNKERLACLGMILELLPHKSDLGFLDDPDEMMRLAHVGEHAINQASLRRLEREALSIALKNEQLDTAYREYLHKAVSQQLEYVKKLESSGTVLSAMQRTAVNRISDWWMKGHYDYMCLEELDEIIEAVGAPPCVLEE